MSVPGQVLFIFVADYIHMSKSTIGPLFVMSYLSVSLLQVSFNHFNPISYLMILFSNLQFFKHYYLFFFHHLDLHTTLHRTCYDPHNVAIQNRSR